MATKSVDPPRPDAYTHYVRHLLRWRDYSPSPAFGTLPCQQRAKFVLSPGDNESLAYGRYGPLGSVLHPSHEHVPRVGVYRGKCAVSRDVQEMPSSGTDCLEGERKLKGSRARTRELYNKFDGLTCTNLGNTQRGAGAQGGVGASRVICCRCLIPLR